MTAATLCSFILTSFAQSTEGLFPVKRQESAESWKRDGWKAVDSAKKQKVRKGKAKNVILFIGDGMGVSTLTAARIFEGQQHGESGEENRLSFEEFPFSALSKTYSANQQTSDSAPTMTAIMTGVKTDEGVLSVDQDVVRSDYRTVKGNETETLLEMAEASGRSTGVVTTTRVTHATPGACYAHTADRNWESDKDIFKWRKDAYDTGFPDIAKQLIEFPYGDGLDVVLGGGRMKFLPDGTPDPDHKGKPGERLDGQDLTKDWESKHPGSIYVGNAADLAAVDARKTKHLLGLFSQDSMEFDADRIASHSDQPSLTTMTTKAIDILSHNKKGFFLMVEAGRIDHAHHYGNAYRALQDTVELSNAVRAASTKVNLDDTLIVVTADHSHTLTIGGYSTRGNNILGLVRELDKNGNVEPDYKRDRLGRPYTTLMYANGPGYTGASENMPEGPKKYPDEPKRFKGITDGRPLLTEEIATDRDYLQEAAVPLMDESHSGVDVAIFATGVDAHLIRGSMEENWIFFVMADAMRLGRR